MRHQPTATGRGLGERTGVLSMPYPQDRKNKQVDERDTNADRRQEERRTKTRRSSTRRHLYCRRTAQLSFDELPFPIQLERRVRERREGCRRVVERRAADRRSDDRRTGRRPGRAYVDPQGFLTETERDFLASLTSSEE